MISWSKLFYPIFMRVHFILMSCPIYIKHRKSIFRSSTWYTNTKWNNVSNWKTYCICQSWNSLPAKRFLNINYFISYGTRGGVHLGEGNLCICDYLRPYYFRIHHITPSCIRTTALLLQLTQESQSETFVKESCRSPCIQKHSALPQWYVQILNSCSSVDSMQ